jgi:hypothetical protein
MREKLDNSRERERAGRLRRMSERAIAVILAAALTVWVSDCGGESTTTSTTTAPKEVAQKLPKLPPGWKARRDRSVGYAIGVPTGWEVGGHGDRVLFRAPDHLVAVTLTADRNPRTFQVPIDRFATKALGALPGFKVPLEPGKPTPFKGTPLKAVQTSAAGTQAGGLEERATLVVLRRDRIVNYTVAVLENAEQPGSELDRAVALRMIQTLRDQPVTKRGGDGSP